MKWLPDSFLRRAQNDARLAGAIPKEQIPFFLQLASAGKDAVLRLTSNRDAGVVEITDVNIHDLATRLNIAKTYLFNQSPDFRASILSSSTNSSIDSPASTVFSGGSRFSTYSTNTDTSIATSATPHHHHPNVKRKARVTPTTYERHNTKTWLCPTCGTYCTEFSDYKKHLQRYCEKEVQRWHCNNCNLSDDDEEWLRELCTDPMHHSIVPEASVPKSAYGCAFCGKCLHSFEEYLRCMQNDQKNNRTLRPWPSNRVKALLTQSEDIKEAVARACFHRPGLRLDAWTNFMWDDLACDLYSSVLEYGCNTDTQVYRRGVEDLDLFIDQLFMDAKFEFTGKPVPPAKQRGTNHKNVAQQHPQPSNYNNHSSAPPKSANQPSTNLVPAETMAYNARTNAGIRQAQQQSLYGEMMPPPPVPPSSKHRLSYGSTNDAESSSRAKRVVLTPHATSNMDAGGSGPSQFMQSQAVTPISLPHNTPNQAAASQLYQLPMQRPESMYPDDVYDLYGQNDAAASNPSSHYGTAHQQWQNFQPNF